MAPLEVKGFGDDLSGANGSLPGASVANNLCCHISSTFAALAQRNVSYSIMGIPRREILYWLDCEVELLHD